MLHSQPSGGVLAIYDLENHSGKGAAFRSNGAAKVQDLRVAPTPMMLVNRLVQAHSVPS